MMRWQERGEVLDSEEDEDRSLSFEDSQSRASGRARKRLKLDDGEVKDGELAASGEADSSQHVEHYDRFNNGTPGSYEDRRTTDAHQPNETVYSSSLGFREISELPSQARELEIAANDSLDASLGSDDSDGLPDIHDLLARRNFGSSDRNAVHAPSTAPSSPLSERDTTPEAPIFQAQPLHARNGADVERHQASLSATQALAGRNLRRRKEIQLHPYLMDNAKYQALCKARGIKPVRIAEASQHALESQDMSDADVLSSQLSSKSRSHSPTRLSSELGEPFRTYQRNFSEPYNAQHSEGSANAHATSNFQRSRGVHHQSKRLKAIHLPQSENQPPQVIHDDFDVPLSPPSTSSSSPITRAVPSGFRVPGRLSTTPAPLPTPQISSETRLLQDANTDSEQDSDVRPPHRNLASARRHGQTPSAVLVSSASESSDTVSEEESAHALDELRLIREKRRIKGVLPASWLKIDLNAQRVRSGPFPAKKHQRQRSPSTSPMRSTQKGVAKVVSRRINVERPARPILVSDDHSDASSVSSGGPRTETFNHQARLHLQHETPVGLERPSVLDDDDMEFDWVDPMLPTQGRKQASTASKKKRQPKIRDAFERVLGAYEIYSEEKRMRDKEPTRSDNKRQQRRIAHSKNTRRPTAPRLSILDAPKSPQEASNSAPQFIRLAQRSALASLNLGRSSPRGKIIRLATEADTSDAQRNLNAWREGTLAPMERDQVPPPPQRLPLSAISRNQRQQRLPSPLRHDSRPVPNSVKWSNPLHTTRLRQSRLGPVEITPRVPGASPAQSPMQSGTPKQTQRLPWRVQTRPTIHRRAQLETLEDEVHRTDKLALFEHCMLELAHLKSMRSQHPSRITQNQLREALMHETRDEVHQERVEHPTLRPLPPSDLLPQPKPRARLPLRQRKQPASRLDVEARQYRQPSEPLPEVNNVDSLEHQSHDTDGEVLKGLGPFGTRYPIDFDLKPLELGTYFHESTFVGSGEFADALTLSGRDLDVSSGRLSIYIEGVIFTWAAWTEDVSAEIARIPEAVGEILRTSPTTIEGTQSSHEQFSLAEQNIEYLLRSVVRYGSKCLSFLDPVDRQPCVARLLNVQTALLDLLADRTEEAHNVLDLRCLTYMIVIAKQALIVADHPLVQPQVRTQCQARQNVIATRLSRLLVSKHLEAVRTFYEDNRIAANREAGIRDDRAAVNSAVVLYHTVSNMDASRTNFWGIMSAALCQDAKALRNVQQMDRVWYDLFSIQPLLEFDVVGIANIGSRLNNYGGDWETVKDLLVRIFALYDANVKVPGSTINDYIRATLCRCHNLVTRWGCWKCETILITIFDFFARRGLAPLHKEESRGSPLFLSEAFTSNTVEISAEDRSFAIFLKLVVAAIQRLRRHNDKKIGSVVWRLIPNHGRTYPKDSEVRQADLDALRNHHDLLCTLYYVSPPSSRPRVDLLRNLVEHSTSHREACRISVRAWADLARFQASTKEPLTNLNPLEEWFEDVLRVTIAQFWLAKSEAEHQFAIAQAQGVSGMTQELLESTIASNQRQIAATLTDCLAALKHALLASSNLEIVLHLATGSQFWQIFDIFDSPQRRLQSAFMEALEVVHTILNVKEKFVSTKPSEESNEESQEYGDMAGLHELAGMDREASQQECLLINRLHQSLWQLVSNAFGADVAAEDNLLSRTVDIWVELACHQVAVGNATWANYIGEFASSSWMQLRETVHRRRYTPYFFARITELASNQLEGLQSTLLATWLSSLVEREAALKFQHTFTAALLNHISHDLLRNLPFARNCKGDYQIVSLELRQRRMALISAVLANMRTSWDRIARQDHVQAQSLRKTYSDMLRHMMHAMRTNYQSLQVSTSEHVASAGVQGAYVEFVQQVVSYLQQYTTDICAVDRFFTDSAAFPLPANDPSYVVGRLRSYVPKLHEERSRKQLAVFVHAVCERAAVDGQQRYLVDQFFDAIDGAGVFVDSSRPGLCFVLFTSVFPAYLEHSLASASAWIVVGPILAACSNILGRVCTYVAWEDEGSVETSVATVGSLLQSCLPPLRMLIEQPALLALSHVLRVVGSIYQLVQSSLTFAEYVTHPRHGSPALRTLVSYLHMLAKALDTHVLTPDDFCMIGDTDEPQAIHGEFHDTLSFARDQVKSTLNSDWYAHEGRYFVRRASVSKEIEVDLQDEATERARLHETLVSFGLAYSAIFDPPGPTRIDGSDYFECIV